MEFFSDLDTNYLFKCLLSLLLITSTTSWIFLPKLDKDKKPDRSPPTLPYTLPLIKSTYSFLFAGEKALRRASHTGQNNSAVRISLLTDDLYLVHGAKNAAAVFRTSSLSVTKSMGIVLRYCFGLSKGAAATYFEDTSGGQEKPIPGSNTEFKDRLYYQTQEIHLEGFLGTGLPPMIDRLEIEMKAFASSLSVFSDWVEYPDLLAFFETNIGAMVIKIIFGSILLSQDPDFVSRLWRFDNAIMSLAQRLPMICAPRAYYHRFKLLQSIKRWHSYARLCSTQSLKGDHKDSDPFWGCKMVRDRYRVLSEAKSHDDDSVASTDLAFIWASVTNVVPSSMALLSYAVADKSLLAALRKEVTAAIEPGYKSNFDLKKLEQCPLLLSMYAETLRLGVQIHIPRHNPHQALHVGHCSIPKDRLIFVNTWLAHTDKDFWETKSGSFPVDRFCPRRFLVDVEDPSSKPHKLQLEAEDQPSPDSRASPGVQYSTEGLEGAWIPYGGGNHACPGRVLAKRIMLLSCATMISMFDIELSIDQKQLNYGSSRFGFGVRKPTGKIPFRVRRREDVTVGSQV